ncbi:MAG: protein-disulfide reductase DsbD family protein [Phycisphaerales bacterium]
MFNIRHAFVGGALAICIVGCVAAAPQEGDSSSVVTVTVLPGRMSAKPGEIVPVAVIFDHKPKWHTQAARTGGATVDEDAVATSISATSSDPKVVARSDALQWPTPITIETKAMGAPSKASVYSDRAIAYMPVEIAPNAAPGNATLTFAVTFQACDDKVCLQPVNGKTFTVAIAVEPKGGAAAEPPAFTYPEYFTAYRPVGGTPAGDGPAGSAASGSGGALVGFGTNMAVIITAVVVAVGVIGVVVIAVLKRT